MIFQLVTNGCFWSAGVFVHQDFRECLTPRSPIFQLYHGEQSYLWRKPLYAEKTTVLPQVTDKPYYITLYEYTLP